MSKQILVLGATGMLGQPVVHSLIDKGHRVRILVRSVEKARQMFGNAVEIIKGNVLNKNNVMAVMNGCNAVHISLTQESELTATQHVINLASGTGLERISYVSATTVCEENRWFELVDVKMRTENLLRRSGIAHTVFCPTWVMETLNNFIRDGRAVLIRSNKPPALHFFAAADFGRMVAASYDDDRALGKRLFIHGPEAITMTDALERFVNACYPEVKMMRLRLWQAQLIARLTRRENLIYATGLIAYFDKVGELGDPTEANTLIGKPSITLDEWFKIRKDNYKGLPH